MGYVTIALSVCLFICLSLMSQCDCLFLCLLLFAFCHQAFLPLLFNLLLRLRSHSRSRSSSCRRSTCSGGVIDIFIDFGGSLSQLQHNGPPKSYSNY